VLEEGAVGEGLEGAGEHFGVGRGVFLGEGIGGVVGVVERGEHGFGGWEKG